MRAWGLAMVKHKADCKAKAKVKATAVKGKAETRAKAEARAKVKRRAKPRDSSDQDAPSSQATTMARPPASAQLNQCSACNGKCYAVLNEEPFCIDSFVKRLTEETNLSDQNQAAKRPRQLVLATGCSGTGTPTYV